MWLKRGRGKGCTKEKLGVFNKLGYNRVEFFSILQKINLILRNFGIFLTIIFLQNKELSLL